MLDRKQFCNEILKIDVKIRFTAIYDEGEFYHKMREGVNPYLTPEETENSLAEAVYRWSSRKKIGPKAKQHMGALLKKFAETKPQEIVEKLNPAAKSTSSVEEKLENSEAETDTGADIDQRAIGRGSKHLPDSIGVEILKPFGTTQSFDSRRIYT